MGDLSFKNVDTSIDVAVGISVVCAVVWCLSLVIGDVYPDLDPSTYQALAVIAPLYIFLPIVRGYNTVHGHVLRALGKTTDVFKINFTGQWVVSIPLCALIIFGLDGSIFGYLAIQPFEEIVKAFPFRHLARKSLKESQMRTKRMNRCIPIVLPASENAASSCRKQPCRNFREVVLF
ncbi:hypothetical protein O9992_00930 [Vibrio lentus]|nr:hypothetical protein [Vibrio lentus]